MPPSKTDPMLVICGPTASGKSRLAMAVGAALAGRGRHAEVIAADAFVVYRGMDIGTAKPTAAERRTVRHHLVDIIEPTERFTVDDWLGRAEECIAQVRQRGATPIVVGGTHLYIKALLDGLFEGPRPDAALRAELAAMDPAARRIELERVDPQAAARIHFNDQRRTVRALEVFRLSGKPISQWQGQWDAGQTRTDALLVTLHWPTPQLNQRINARVRAMMEMGLLEEVRVMHDGGRLGPTSREALGYKQLVEHLQGRCTLEEAVERVKIETRRFAKNQRTWLKRLGALPGTISLDMSALSEDQACRRVLQGLATERPGP